MPRTRSRRAKGGSNCELAIKKEVAEISEHGEGTAETSELDIKEAILVKEIPKSKVSMSPASSNRPSNHTQVRESTSEIGGTLLQEDGISPKVPKPTEKASLKRKYTDSELPSEVSTNSASKVTQEQESYCNKSESQCEEPRVPINIDNSSKIDTKNDSNTSAGVVKEETIEERENSSERKRPRRLLRQRTNKPNYKEIDSDEEKRLESRLALKRKAKESDDHEDDYVASSESSSDSESFENKKQLSIRGPKLVSTDQPKVKTEMLQESADTEKDGPTKQFKEAMKKNQLKYQNQVRAGEILSSEEKEKRREAFKALGTKEKKLHQARMRVLQKQKVKAKRMHLLTMELKMLQCCKQIRDSLATSKPNVTLCLELLATMKSLSFSPICLLKNPSAVECIRKIKHYKPDKRVQQSAAEIYKMFECMFGIPDKITFIQHFRREVVKFEQSVTDWVHMRSRMVQEARKVCADSNVAAEEESSSRVGEDGIEMVDMIDFPLLDLESKEDILQESTLDEILASENIASGVLTENNEATSPKSVTNISTKIGAEAENCDIIDDCNKCQATGCEEKVAVDDLLNKEINDNDESKEDQTHEVVKTPKDDVSSNKEQNLEFLSILENFGSGGTVEKEKSSNWKDVTTCVSESTVTTDSKTSAVRYTEMSETLDIPKPLRAKMKLQATENKTTRALYAVLKTSKKKAGKKEDLVSVSTNVCSIAKNVTCKRSKDNDYERVKREEEMQKGFLASFTLKEEPQNDLEYEDVNFHLLSDSALHQNDDNCESQETEAKDQVSVRTCKRRKCRTDSKGDRDQKIVEGQNETDISEPTMMGQQISGLEDQILKKISVQKGKNISKSLEKAENASTYRIEELEGLNRKVDCELNVQTEIIHDTSIARSTGTAIMEKHSEIGKEETQELLQQKNELLMETIKVEPSTPSEELLGASCKKKKRVSKPILELSDRQLRSQKRTGKSVTNVDGNISAPQKKLDKSPTITTQSVKPIKRNNRLRGGNRKSDIRFQLSQGTIGQKQGLLLKEDELDDKRTMSQNKGERKKMPNAVGEGDSMVALQRRTEDQYGPLRGQSKDERDEQKSSIVNYNQPRSPTANTDKVKNQKEQVESSRSCHTSPNTMQEYINSEESATLTRENLDDTSSRNAVALDKLPSMTEVKSEEEKLVHPGFKRTRSKKKEVSSSSMPNTRLPVRKGTLRRGEWQSKSLPTSPLIQPSIAVQVTDQGFCPDRKCIAENQSDPEKLKEKFGDSLSSNSSNNLLQNSDHQQASECEKLKSKRTASMRLKRSRLRSTNATRSLPSSPMVSTPKSEDGEGNKSESLPASPSDQIRSMFAVLSGAWSKLCRTFSK